jgi:arylsulfatase A-like enzyme
VCPVLVCRPSLANVGRYFDLYDLNKVSLAPNRNVPVGFREENFHSDGTFELVEYTNAGPAFKRDHQDFGTPLDADFSRAQRRGYFAAVSFVDACVGRVVDALEKEGYKDNTVVLLWGDHGWHLGDTNSWGKMTNFESATRNALLWRVPGQRAESKGLNARMVESIDIFPTVVALTGVAAIPSCTGVDQPPTTLCLQGTSYATEFLPAQPVRGGGAQASAPAPSVLPLPPAPKRYAFSQWPFPKWGNETALREGYTVRSASGFRYTTYVPCV